MLSSPLSQTELDARLSGHLDELLHLWWAEQGASKPKDLDLIARTLPFSRTQAIRVLDLCCGPGDVGRAIRERFPQSHIDAIDRDPFLLSLCAAANRRAGIPGTIIRADLTDDSWLGAVGHEYDAIAVVNALHWFDCERIAAIVRQARGLLRDGGVLVLAEPAVPEAPFIAGFDEWKAAQPPRYTREAWQRFWSRATEILGYDHTLLLGPRREPHDLTVAGWSGVVERAGFSIVDVLLRDADQAILGAVR